ncbi:MAG TPA: hypothetical protein VHM20_05665, partial [Gammaproteobacteria bacterium]|nr:hypothetical protein [Gammaproteobacteria bacterium]
ITHENLAKVENAFIEQMIEMEKYEENYARKKKLNLKENEIDKKAALEDDFVTILVKKSDSVVKKIYPEEYFSRENKTDNSNTLENFLNYYDINTKDTETIKNIKLLFNGMIGLKKVLNDHEEYQQSGFFQSVGWMTTFIKDLRRAYNSLFQFDYQAIIAEQSRPFIEEIKRQLKKLNLLLEKLACIADKLENELHLKDGYLLNHVELLLDRYNQITYELRIPIDYIRQKHVYYKARLDAHENDLMEIERQLIKLRHFLIFKNVPLGDIPYDTIVSLKDYIEKYNDDICMNRDRLDIYKDYLTDTLNTKRNLETFILSHFEMAANYLGLTIHNELMQSLRSRMLYLKKQQDFLEKRFADILEYYKQTPYIYFKPHDKADAILPKLKKHIESLTQEKEILSKKSEEELKNNKTSKLEEIKPRLANQLQLKTNELCFFQSFIKKYEETNEVNPIEEKDILPPKSAMMIKEITEIVLHGNHAPKTHAP